MASPFPICHCTPLHSRMAPSGHAAHTPEPADSELSANLLDRLSYLVDSTHDGDQPNSVTLRSLLAPAAHALEKLKASSNRYHKQQTTLQDKIFLLQAAIAPVRWVPIEVLGIIFGFLVASDPDAVIRVGRVCGRWRQASRFPELWSHIMVAREGPGPLSKVNLFQERSSHCLLTVKYSQSSGAADQWEAWDALMLTAQRWSTLALTFDDCRSASFRIPRLLCSPVMEELSVAIRGAGPIASEEGNFGFEDYYMETAPHLRSLIISAHVLPRPSLWFNSLTKLHIIDTFAALQEPLHDLRPIDGHQILQVLLFCQTLVEFIFEGEKSANWLVQNTTATLDLRLMPLRLPDLRHLHLSCFSQIGYVLLRDITAVNLETMTLRLYPRSESTSFFEPSALANFFFTRSPLLRSLTMYGLNHTVMTLALHREVLKQLEELHLENMSGLQYIARVLIWGNDSDDWAVPRLSNLTVLSNRFDVPFDEFALAIRRRYSANRQRGTPAYIRNYVVNGQNLLGAAPGTTVAFQRPIRFQH
jgi:F-box-like